MRNVFKVFLGLFLLIFLVACTKNLEEIKIEGKTEIFVNESFTFTTNIEVKEFNVEIDGILSVDQNGLVTGIQKGTATIKITFIDKREEFFIVEVKELEEVEELEEIKIVAKSVISLNNSFKLTANIEIISITCNNNVVSVLENNIIKGMELGKATLTIVFIDERVREIEITVNDEIVFNGKREIYVGEEFILSANFEIKDYSYDNTLIKIYGQEIVQGLKEGNAIITVTFIDDRTKTFEVTILPQETLVTNIETEMVEGDKYNLEINIPLISLLSNSENLIVSEDGEIFAKKAGEAILTIILIDNREFSYNIVIGENLNYEYYHTKVLSLDIENMILELLDVPITKFDEHLVIEKLSSGTITKGTLNELYLGMENIYVRVNKKTNLIEKLLIEGDVGFSNIRVGIRNNIGDISDDYTLFHDVIKFNTSSTTLFKTFDNEISKKIASGKQVEIEVFDEKIEIFVDSILIASTTKRIMFIPKDESSEMKVTSIFRSQGNPSYAGNFEISLVNGRLLLINDVSLENYLTKVVPSEMPTSYNMEALKAQSIAARTYAYADILNRSTSFYGYSVDDSVKSQVYNNAAAQTRGNEAVFATSGMIMMSGDSLVQAFYYSTSSGLTGSASEIWFNGEVPYLVGQNLTTDDLGNIVPIDPTNEASMLAFFKTIKLHHPDESINYHRWKVTFTKADLLKTLNINLSNMRESAPNDFLTKSGDSWLN